VKFLDIRLLLSLAVLLPLDSSDSSGVQEVRGHDLDISIVKSVKHARYLLLEDVITAAQANLRATTHPLFV
jgi:hypothetical protein